MVVSLIPIREDKYYLLRRSGKIRAQHCVPPLDSNVSNKDRKWTTDCLHYVSVEHNVSFFFFIPGRGY